MHEHKVSGLVAGYHIGIDADTPGILFIGPVRGERDRQRAVVIAGIVPLIRENRIIEPGFNRNFGNIRRIAPESFEITAGGSRPSGVFKFAVISLFSKDGDVVTCVPVDFIVFVHISPRFGIYKHRFHASMETGGLLLGNHLLLLVAGGDECQGNNEKWNKKPFHGRLTII